MPNLAVLYPKVTPWAEFSAKLARYYNLPNGSRFALKRQGAAGKISRGIVRSDVRVRRRPLRDAEHPNRHGSRLTASELFRRIEKMLAPHHHRFRVVGLGPDGKRIDGHTTLGAWRRKPSKPTTQQIQLEKEGASLRREEIRGLTVLAYRAIADLEEGIEDPEQKIPQAVLQALLDQFDHGSVRDAVRELRL